MTLVNFFKKTITAEFVTTRTTTTPSLFQVKYNLQSLFTQLAKAIRGGHKRKKKKILWQIYIFIKN